MKTIEKEYTKTPNVSLAIIASLPGSAGRVYATMLRFSYGWKKDTVKLGIATLSKLTGLSENGVKAGATTLISIKAISRLNAEDQKNAMWKINDPSIIDPSIIDPSIIDPSIIDAFTRGKPSIIDGYRASQPSIIDPRPPRIKERVKERVGKETTTGKKKSAGGGRSSSSSKDWIEKLKLREIWTAAGLGKQKTDDVLQMVAEKFKPADAKRKILAALASAYTDPNAKNKPVIAKHRLENEQVPPEYLSSDTWQIIPDEILKAAHIDIERLKNKQLRSEDELSRDLKIAASLMEEQ
ncbi:MAG: hypothetical protein QY332_14700 [Anaerolineales bacterium]|nr:MAG: hypothetical protein QY332_14700 [Anaerolineales bacterium]